MIVRAKRSIALLLAFLMIASCMQFMSLTNVYADDVTIDSVRTAIQALSADPTQYTEADKERVEAIWADFQALSAEDQATLDAECTHSGTSQSLGRVLESALWAVWSYTIDTSTTLEAGTYTITTDPAVSSESSKGKSDSSRVRNWWVESVEVEDGNATAKIYVTGGAATASKVTSYSSVWVGGKTISRDADNNYTIPVDLNGKTYFGGISSSMPTPIMYSLDTTIQEPEVKTDLTIQNKIKMYKAASAYLQTIGNKTSLVMALSADGYHELFKGTFEQAVANDNATENWIHGYKNADDKWEFIIPLDDGETCVPIVSISDSYYQGYLNNENELKRAFYPRQLEIDRVNNLLITGDYDSTFEVEVKNTIEMFKPGDVADLQVIGGPNSNGYSAFITLHMASASMDKVKSFEYDYRDTKLTEGAEVIIDADADNKFVKVPVLPAILDGGSVILKFHSVKQDKWYNRKLTISLADKKAVFSPMSEEEEAAEGINDAKREAQKAVNEAEALDTSVYTPENAQAIKDALQALKALVASDTATAEDISTAKATLENAVTKAKADKEAADLQAAKEAAQAALTQAEAIDTSVYSSENAQAIKDAIAALKDLIASDTATADQITAANQALTAAITKANNDKNAEEEAKKKAEEEAKKKAIAKQKAKVKATKITGLKVKAGKKKMTVIWKKNAKVFGGYQIRYKVGKKTKTIKIKKASIAKKVIKKLKSKKKYTVKVRGFKKVNGALVYGKWSAAKKAKIR